MANSFTHGKDCPDRAAAAADRAAHKRAANEREARLQVAARAEWFDWYAAVPHRPYRSRRDGRA